MGNTPTLIVSAGALGLNNAGYRNAIGIPDGARIVLDGQAIEDLPATLPDPPADASVNISVYAQLSQAFAQFNDGLQSSRYQASVSDPSIAEARITGTIAQSTVISLNITQLAQAQQLSSDAFSLPSETVGYGSLTIDFGRYDNTQNSFEPSTTNTLLQLPATGANLQRIADTINDAQLGLVASIEQNSSGYQLVLESALSGTQSSIRIQVNDEGDGNNVDQQGLSRLAYDPTAATGAGKNLVERQAAKDAEFEAERLALLNGSNNVTELIPGLTITLKQSGAVTVRTGTPFAGILRTTENIVNQYNQFVEQLLQQPRDDGLAKLLQSQSDQDPLGLAKKQTELDNWLQAAKSELEQFGLFQQGGKLSLDSAQLQAQWQTNPRQSENWLESFRQRLITQSQPSPLWQGQDPIGKYYLNYGGLL